MSDFKLVDRAVVTNDMVTSDLVEPVAAWNSGTTYAAEQQSSKGQRVWESVQGSNLNHDPEADDGTWWIDAGPSNDWAMFDEQNSTQSTREDSITVSIDTEARFDTLALFNVSAASVRVRCLEGATVHDDQTVSMVDYNGISDYWDHFMNPVKRTDFALVEGLPLTPTGMTLEVTATDDEGETVAIGNLVYGQAQVLGGTQFGAEVGFLNFSKFGDDGFGGRRIIAGIYKKQGSFNVWVDNDEFDWVYRTLVAYKDTPALIIASQAYSAMVYFGLILSAKQTLTYPRDSVLRLQTEDF